MTNKPKTKRCSYCRTLIPISDFAEHTDMEKAQLKLVDVAPLQIERNRRSKRQGDY